MRTTSQFIIFLGFVTLILSSGLYYLDLRLFRRIAQSDSQLFALRTLIFIIFVLQYLVPLSYRQKIPYEWDGWVHAVSWLGYGSLGLLALLLFFTIGFDLLEWISMKTHLDDTNFHRRLFLTRTGPIITAGAALLSTGAGFVQATRGPKNKTVEIPIPNLPIEFENYTIAQISDLHIGPTIGPEYIEKTIQEANSAKPDLIALTGDLMDGYAEQIGKGFELLNKLQAPDGKFFITGNHEYFWNAIDWIQKAKETGMIPLLNEHRTIQRGESQLIIAGVPDMMAERFSSDHKIDFEKAFNSAPPARLAPRVLLSHNPNTFEEARKHQISLQLSGHTHSGQFYPFRFFANIPYRHFRGLYSLNENQTHIYVNPGTGYWGPPNRLGIPSEITILKLKRAPIS